MTEKEKMIAGMMYDPLDEELTRQRERAHDLCHRLNQILPSNRMEIDAIIASLLSGDSESAFITPPFFCDYGWNIIVGKSFYCNADCVILDCAPVTIGSHVLLGPKVQIYTPLHPLHSADRADLEYASPITIGDKVWIGGGSIVCAGVNIGSGTVIGAGSVVTRNIPPNCLAVGNPCRAIRQL